MFKISESSALILTFARSPVDFASRLTGSGLRTCPRTGEMHVAYVEAEYAALIGSWDGTLFLIQLFQLRMGPR